MEKKSLLTPGIKELLSKDKEELKEILKDLHPADIAEIIPTLDEEEKFEVFNLLESHQVNEVFDRLEEEDEALILKKLDKTKQKQILSNMAPDEKADLFEELPEKIVSKLFKLMTDKERYNLKKLLAYAENSAGAIMTTEYIALHSDISSKEAIEKIRQISPRKEAAYFTYVTDQLGKLIGFVSLKNMVFSNPEKKLKEIMNENVIFVNTEQDQEEVANIIHKYDLIAIPVTDNENRLQGVITVDDIMDVVEEENTEDIYKMASMEALDEKYFDTSFFTLAKKRILWLTVLLITYTISTQLLQHYSATIELLVALAYFIPMLTGSGGNAGTQTATLIIRGIAVGEIKFKQIFRVLKREIGMGIILGSFLGILGFLRAMFMEKNPTLSIVVGIALALTITMATLTGSLLPLLMRKLKLDPAIAAGPFLTTIVDVTSLVIYFETAKWLLSI